MASKNTDIVKVGVAEYALTTDERTLRTSGVGSCGVVAVHDERAGVSGLLHFMLPQAESEARAAEDPPAKFADLGIEAMLEEFKTAGGNVRRSYAKLAGGATMLSFDSFDRPIGERNVEAAQEALGDRSIPIQGEDVGGESGRMVSFDPVTGELSIKTGDGENRTV